MTQFCSAQLGFEEVGPVGARVFENDVGGINISQIAIAYSFLFEISEFKIRERAAANRRESSRNWIIFVVVNSAK